MKVWKRNEEGVREIVDVAEESQLSSVNKFFIRNSGRIYGYSDERWISIHDDLYGSNYPLYNENAGTGDEPDKEWEHNGVLIPSGFELKNFFLLGRTNSTQYTDLKICIKEVYPNPLSRFATGYDNDSEITSNIIFEGLFTDMIQEATSQPASGNMADKRLGKAVINHVFNQDSELRMYVKPIGNLTGTKYFAGTWTFEFK